jgi:hypothetical protein
MRKSFIDTEPEKHESYGLVSLSRVTCTPPMALFGSSIRHSNLINLKIHKGKKYRDFQNDHYMDDGLLCEVYLSPTQFAEAITSFNVGCGVPCTLNHVIGDKFDEQARRFRQPCPEVNIRQLANQELKSEMSELKETVDRLSKDAKEILNQKGALKKADKDKLLKDLMFLAQEIGSNIPFVHECFNKSVNKTVTEAKGEIDATLQSMRERLGDKVLNGEIEVPLLNDMNAKKGNDTTVE